MAVMVTPDRWAWRFRYLRYATMDAYGEAGR